MMKVMVAGATGAVGQRVVSRLVAAGHDVLALARRPTGADRVRASGAVPVAADIMDGDGLIRAVDGRQLDGIVHQATAISGVPRRHSDLDATDALRDEGTRNLLRAGQALGVRRFVTQSFFLGYGWQDHGYEPLTEDKPFGVEVGGKFDAHLRSLRSNEDQVLASEGGVALRYGLFYGPDAMTRTLLRLCRRRVMPAPRPAGTLHPIHVDDAADAAVAALERGRAGQAYNVVDDQPVGMDEYLDAMASAAGTRRPLRVPASLLRPWPYLHALLTAVHIRLSNDKAKYELGWRPRFPSCREGLTALAGEAFDD
ncbi:MAG TPA: NAD(P)-dependent oxidoreductase [Micromonosporaceae bacterium]|nr:NAD(P)-dependent oxidoreductase [Micromonosporaceae bacterium]